MGWYLEYLFISRSWFGFQIPKLLHLALSPFQDSNSKSLLQPRLSLSVAKGWAPPFTGLAWIRNWIWFWQPPHSNPNLHDSIPGKLAANKIQWNEIKEGRRTSNDYPVVTFFLTFSALWGGCQYWLKERQRNYWLSFFTACYWLETRSGWGWGRIMRRQQ